MYEEMGVDPHKDSVKEIFGKITKNDYPNAFCKIIKDPWDPDWVSVKHSDGSGSKSVQRVLHHLEIGNPEIYQDDVFDAVGMNMGDVAASGFVDQPYLLTDNISICALDVDKKLILKQLAIGFLKVIALYRKYGFDIKFLGGETADLVDQCNSYILDADVYTRARKEDVIQGNVCHGDLIWGFASDGQAIWEDKPNSGIMSNGLTMARKVLMSKEYSEKYPQLCHFQKSYQGKCQAQQQYSPLEQTISEAILSPTRQWAIVIKLLLNELDKIGKRHLVHGISMNTGGGATKIKNVGKNIRYVKNMPDPPYIFRTIRSESREIWQNMFTTFNMGIGLDIVGSDECGILRHLIGQVSAKTNIHAFELGHCETALKNEVLLKTVYGSFKF